MMVPICAVSVLTMYCMIAITSRGALYGWAVVYGIFSAAIQSLFPAALSSLTTDLRKAGVRMGMVFVSTFQVSSCNCITSSIYWYMLIDCSQLCCTDRTAHIWFVDPSRRWSLHIRTIVCGDVNADWYSLYGCCQNCNVRLGLESQNLMILFFASCLEYVQAFSDGHLAKKRCRSIYSGSIECLKLGIYLNI